MNRKRSFEPQESDSSEYEESAPGKCLICDENKPNCHCYWNDSNTTNSKRRKEYTFHECFECGRVMLSRGNLATHLWSVHNNPKFLDRSEQEWISICQKTSNTASSSPPDKKTSLEILPAFENTKPYQCGVCGAAYFQIQNLDKHVKAAHTLTTTCKECKIKFPNKILFSEHLKTVHRKYDCPECNQTFFVPNKLTTHKEVVHPKLGLYDCPECPETFPWIGNFLRHMMQIHNGFRLIKCDYCNEEYLHEINLVNHIKIVHKKIKQQKCDKCEMSFVLKCDLSYHLQNAHKDAEQFSNKAEKAEKKIKTNICQKTTTTLKEKSNLECSGNFAHKQLQTPKRNDYFEVGHKKAATIKHNAYEVMQRQKLNSHAAARIEKSFPLNPIKRNDVLLSKPGEPNYSDSLQVKTKPSIINADYNSSLQLSDLHEVCDEKSKTLKSKDREAIFPLKQGLSNCVEDIQVKATYSTSGDGKISVPNTAGFSKQDDILQKVKITDCFVPCLEELNLTDGRVTISMKSQVVKANKNKATPQKQGLSNPVENLDDISEGAACEVGSAEHPSEQDLHKKSQAGKYEGNAELSQKSKQKSSQKSSLLKNITHAKKVQPFSCTICEIRFTKKCDFLLHMKSLHIDQKPFKCTYCDKAFTFHSNLSKHLLEHEVKKFAAGSECTAEYSERSKLALHTKNAHKKVKSHQCSECDMKFESVERRLRHWREIHQTRLKPVKCRECGYSFNKKEHLSLHIAAAHGPGRPHKCNECGKIFVSADYLTSHLKMHMGCKTP